MENEISTTDLRVQSAGYGRDYAAAPGELVRIPPYPFPRLQSNRTLIRAAAAPPEQFREKWAPLFRQELRQFKRMERFDDSVKH
jgi:hypothetical protein